MKCPKCNSDCWDNSEKVSQGWRGPITKCKNQSCDFLVWPPRDKGQRKPNNPQPREPKFTWSQLSTLYGESLKIAVAQVGRLKDVKWLAGPPTAADVLSAAATCFIAASRDGVRSEVPLDQPPPGIQDTEDDREIDDRFSRARRA